jgi:putative ABC transport system permease protein
MRLTWKLTLSYVWRHPARVLLTSLAMVASACVVVWVVGGYDAMVSQFGSQASEYLGRYDLFLVPDGIEETYISNELIEQMREDPAIAEFEPVLQATVRVQTDKPMEMGPGAKESASPNLKSEISKSPNHQIPKSPIRPSPSARRGPPRPMFFGGPKLVGTHADKPPYKLLEGRWIQHGNPKLREAVISNQSAEQLQVKLGDEVLVISGTKEYRLTIVGIAEQATTMAPTRQAQSPTGRPMMSGPGSSLGPAAAALYVPMPLAEKITRFSGKINLLNIKLHDSEKSGELRSHWLPQVAQAKPPVLLVGKNDLKSAMDEGMMAANARRQAWAATGMSLLAALFIIFTTLSMGVHERVRQFAILRAVGLTRLQVAWIIAAESLVLALIGWGGGLAAGYGLLTVAGKTKPELFTNGASLGAWCILLTGISAFGGASIASIFPAWQATSVQPLEAMSPRRSVRPSMTLSIAAGVAGLLLIGINPYLVFVMPIPDAARYGIYEAIGCTSMALGFLLLSPMAIIVIEAVFGPWIARFIGLEPRLLHSQLSSNLLRTLGTTVALTVGLGLYVSMMVWGYSMLGPFKPGDWVPDMLVAIQSGALPDTEIENIRRMPGVISEQCIPLAVEQPRLAEDITGSRQGNSVTRQDNVIIIGLDPQAAFGGEKPLIGAEFVQENAAIAVKKLKGGKGDNPQPAQKGTVPFSGGRYCIVPDHFLEATGLKIGDRFGMIPPEKPDKPVEYTIAGAVSLPGWHWMTKFSGLRRRSGRSAAMVFANYDDVRRDFDIKQINFIWMNIDKNVGVEKIGAGMQPIVDRYQGERQPVNAQGAFAMGATMFGQSLRISTPDEVRTRILARADDMIWAMCQLPLITLLVTSLGVVNTIMASVRARRWELGVLRALGITRSALFRMILAEGFLIGLVACMLSLGFGIMAGWCGTGISQYVSFFGGMNTPLVVPWAKLAQGFAATLALCLAAALWPAISTGRAEPLTLLQEGRATL